MYTARETVGPSALTEYVDGLEPENMAGLGRVRGLDLCFTYGSPDEEDRRLEQLDAELGACARDYLAELEAFVSTSPTYALPGFIDGPWNARPEHQVTGWELNTWLHAAQKYLPGAEQEVMEDIVTCIVDCFDPEQFELAIPFFLEKSEPRLTAQHKLHRRARELSNTTTAQLCNYATSIETISRFLSSSFMQTFGSNLERTVLQARILELTGEGSSADYTNLLTEAALEFRLENLLNNSQLFSWVAERATEATLQLFANLPQPPDTIREFGRIVLSHADSGELGEGQQKLLTILEEQATTNVDEYAEFVRNRFRSTGILYPEYIENLETLLVETANASPWVYKILYATLPIDRVTSLIEQHPKSLADQETAAVCVRRFAAEGQTEKAYDIIQATEGDVTRPGKLAVIRNLLSVYDETGDDTAFQEAQKRLQTLQEHVTLDEGELHELLARSFIAARRHEHSARAQQLAVQMEPYYVHRYAYIREEALGRMVRVALDEQDPQTAEYYAAQLHAWDREKGTKALLHVLRSHVETGNIAAATSVTQTYFATEQPPHELEIALTILNNKKPSYMPTLPEGHLNAITAVLDPGI